MDDVVKGKHYNSDDQHWNDCWDHGIQPCQQLHHNASSEMGCTELPQGIFLDWVKSIENNKKRQKHRSAQYWGSIALLECDGEEIMIACCHMPLSIESIRAEVLILLFIYLFILILLLLLLLLLWLFIYFLFWLPRVAEQKNP